MKKLIKEARRFQQLAGILNEDQGTLRYKLISILDPEKPDHLTEPNTSVDPNTNTYKVEDTHSGIVYTITYTAPEGDWENLKWDISSNSNSEIDRETLIKVGEKIINYDLEEGDEFGLGGKLSNIQY
jgi:hypothetical protein